MISGDINKCQVLILCMQDHMSLHAQACGVVSAGWRHKVVIGRELSTAPRASP